MVLSKDEQRPQPKEIVMLAHAELVRHCCDGRLMTEVRNAEVVSADRVYVLAATPIRQEKKCLFDSIFRRLKMDGTYQILTYDG